MSTHRMGGAHTRHRRAGTTRTHTHTHTRTFPVGPPVDEAVHDPHDARIVPQSLLLRRNHIQDLNLVGRGLCRGGVQQLVMSTRVSHAGTAGSRAHPCSAPRTSEPSVRPSPLSVRHDTATRWRSGPSPASAARCTGCCTLRPPAHTHAPHTLAHTHGRTGTLWVYRDAMVPARLVTVLSLVLVISVVRSRGVVFVPNAALRAAAALPRTALIHTTTVFITARRVGGRVRPRPAAILLTAVRVRFPLRIAVFLGARRLHWGLPICANTQDVVGASREHSHTGGGSPPENPPNRIAARSLSGTSNSTSTSSGHKHRTGVKKYDRRWARDRAGSSTARRLLKLRSAFFTGDRTGAARHPRGPAPRTYGCISHGVRLRRSGGDKGPWAPAAHSGPHTAGGWKNAPNNAQGQGPPRGPAERNAPTPLQSQGRVRER